MCAGGKCLSDGYQVLDVLIPSFLSPRVYPCLPPLRACCMSAFLVLTLGLTSYF